MTRLEAAAHAARLKRSEATYWRWARAGGDFDDPESIKAFLIETERKKTNVQRYRERRGKQPKESAQPVHRRTPDSVEPPGNGELPPIGKLGAAAALERLEQAEERAHARLEAALKAGDPVDRDQRVALLLGGLLVDDHASYAVALMYRSLDCVQTLRIARA